MKNLFNKKLFAEALRQIRIPFALFTGIMLGFSIIMTISNLFNGSEEYKLYHNSVYIFTSDALLYLPIAFALVMPVFIFKLFKFLTKRNASDFYHAIPCKRTCIMFTYATAALTATLVLTLVSSLITIISYSVANEYIIFNEKEALSYLVNIIACTVLSMGICLLSSSLTGTFFTNLLFTIGLMIGPRLVIYTFTESLTTNLSEILPYNYNFGILGYKTNLIFSQFVSMDYMSEDVYRLGFNTIYTFILGIIYIVIAFVMFNRRKSEQAENSSSNPFAHHTIRVGIGYILSLFAVLDYISYSVIDTNFYIEVVTYIVVAIAVMCIYEVLSTKKAKNLLNVVISLPVVAVLCVVSYFVLTTAENNILNYEPKTAELDSIQYTAYDSLYSFECDYYKYAVSQVEFTDKELLYFVTEKYSDVLNAYKAYRENDASSDNYYYSFSEVYKKDNRITIAFKENGKSVEREIYLTNEEFTEFNQLLRSNDEYTQAYHSLPKEYSLTNGTEPFTKDEVNQIIKSFESELKELPMEKLEKLFGSHYGVENVLVAFEGESYVNSATYYFNINITPDLKNTYELVLDILAKKSDNQKATLDKLKEYVNNISDFNTPTDYCYISFYVFDIENQEFVTRISMNEFTYERFDTDNIKYGYTDLDSFKAAHENFVNNTASPSNSKYLVMVTVDAYSDSGAYEELYTHFYSNDNELIPAVVKYNEEAEEFYDDLEEEKLDY